MIEEMTDKDGVRWRDCNVLCPKCGEDLGPGDWLLEGAETYRMECECGAALEIKKEEVVVTFYAAILLTQKPAGQTELSL